MRTLCLLFILSSTVCIGQTSYDNYDKLISEANTWRNQGNCFRAIEKYKAALDILIPNSATPFFRIAECALNNGDIALANEWIRKGVSVGGADKDYLKSYDGFAEIQEEAYYQQILSDYNLLRQEYFSSIDDIDLYLQIEELVARDQFARSAGLYLSGYSELDYQNAADRMRKAREEKDSVAYEKYRRIMFAGTPREHEKTLDALMRRVDSLNIARLIEITEEHGWQQGAWIILWHQRSTFGEDNYIWNYFKPLIDEEIEAGKLSRSFWGAFEQFKIMLEKGDFGTIKLGEREKSPTQKEKNKG